MIAAGASVGMRFGMGLWMVSGLSAAPPCDAPGADPWIAETSRHVLETDRLVDFAEDAFGAPIECEGEVTDRFDGEPFGVVTFRFREGVTFTFDTMPPRITVATLRASEGFDDPDAVLAALRGYAEGLGLSIMWAGGSARAEAGEESEQFWDPDLSLNASATVTRADGALVAVRLSRAP